MMSNNAFVGAFSGLSVVLLQPLEILKVTLIVNPTQKLASHNASRQVSSLATGVKLIYQMGGLRGFYKGLFPASVESVAGAAVYFQTLHSFNKTSKYMGLHGSKADFATSAAARMVATVMTNPFAVIRTRLQIPGFTGYSNVFDGARKIYASEGSRGFLKGVAPAIVKDAPFAGLYYALMNITKEHLKPLNLSNSSSTMTAGMIAGMIATSVTHPLEILRTMAQVDSKKQQDGYFSRLSSILGQDGVKGLTKGLAPRLLKKPLANTLAFAMFEVAKKESNA
jgi:hypothetical protein